MNSLHLSPFIFGPQYLSSRYEGRVGVEPVFAFSLFDGDEYADGMPHGFGKYTFPDGFVIAPIALSAYHILTNYLCNLVLQTDHGTKECFHVEISKATVDITA